MTTAVSKNPVTADVSSILNPNKDAGRQVTADIALDVSRETLEVVQEIREGEQAPAENDHEPDREHPFFRSRRHGE